MFKAIRLTILLLILFFVAVSSWLSQSRSTDWNNSLWVKIYPINGDGSELSGHYIDTLTEASFAPIEKFVARELETYGHSLGAGGPAVWPGQPTIRPLTSESSFVITRRMAIPCSKIPLACKKA